LINLRQIIVRLDDTADVDSDELAKLGLTTSGIGRRRPATEIDAVRAQIAAQRAAGEEYWKALVLEIMTGCRCGRTPDPTSEAPETDNLLFLADPLNHCVCGKWHDGYSTDHWQSLCDLDDHEWGDFPSRIRSMLDSRLHRSLQVADFVALRDILLVTLCHDQRVQDAEPWSADSVMGTTEIRLAATRRLLDQLDPDRLVDQIRRGFFDWSIFNLTADALLKYCAAPRDASVETMRVSAVEQHHIDGLKQLFDMTLSMQLVSEQDRLGLT
jgi:hypothetical protein